MGAVAEPAQTESDPDEAHVNPRDVHPSRHDAVAATAVLGPVGPYTGARPSYPVTNLGTVTPPLSYARGE